MPAAVPLAIAAAGVASSAIQANSAKKAGAAAARGANAGVDEQRRQFDTALQLQAGERFRGNEAGNALARMLGLQQFGPQQQTSENFRNGLDASGESLTSLVGDAELPVEGRRIVARDKNNFDVFYGDQQVGQLVRGGKNGRFLGNGNAIPQPMAPQQPAAPAPAGGAPGADPNAEFFGSPDYNFRRTEGQRDIQGAFAARGGAQSGNALRALSEFNSNLASGEFGNRFNRLAALAGIGQAANAQGANNAINTGRGVAAGLQDAGSARASGVAGTGQAYADGIAGLAGTIPLFQDAFRQKQQTNYNQLAKFRGYGGV